MAKKRILVASGKSKYQRAVDAAKSRGYSSPYAERKAQAQRLGFSSPRTLRNEREFWAGKRRDTRAEYQTAQRRANLEGYRNSGDRAAARRSGLTGAALEAWQKQRVLSYFGISATQFDRIRSQNRKWSRENPSQSWTKINTYDLTIDGNLHNWGETRVGYILAFHGAIVNPKTNYDSLVGDNGKRLIGKTGKRITNKNQFYYLVKYTGIMSIDEFEARYGATVIKEAKEGKVTP